jgi:hypothetical protein
VLKKGEQQQQHTYKIPKRKHDSKAGAVNSRNKEVHVKQANSGSAAIVFFFWWREARRKQSNNNNSKSGKPEKKTFHADQNDACCKETTQTNKSTGERSKCTEMCFPFFL